MKNEEYDEWQEGEDQHEWVSWVLFGALTCASVGFAIIVFVALGVLLTKVVG